ncbi:hypothetical protein PVL29_006614 [Vitis rotundifolia]|uniref:WW domain-containing protein n=1 Tax=Vitis rotundifolia TaxID=103349 RepID=A0AA39A5X5_VITRO|nr:hypothetical protein PVL29_006614 [Vitis rotundifolia]
MMKEFMQQEIDHMKEENSEKSQQFWRIMEFPELSLAPSPRHVADKSTNSSSSESETNYPSKKRKFSDHLFNRSDPMIQTSVDLQLKDPLPLDWEQCLDLESGRMYYLNRKTLRKSWNCPKDHNQQKLDLELNISTLSNCPEKCSSFDSQRLQDHSKKHQHRSTSSNMVALACLNCHLLVILSKSSPSCPNCKYVHSLPTQQIPTSKAPSIKSLDTLSLLN